MHAAIGDRRGAFASSGRLARFAAAKAGCMSTMLVACGQGPSAHQLVRQHEHGLQAELPVAEVEQVLQAGPEQVHHQDIVVAFHAKPPYVPDPRCAAPCCSEPRRTQPSMHWTFSASLGSLKVEVFDRNAMHFARQSGVGAHCRPARFCRASIHKVAAGVSSSRTPAAKVAAP